MNEGLRNKALDNRSMTDPAIHMDAAMEQVLLRHRKKLAVRDHEANKGTYGRLTLLAGSHGMAGAAFLSGLAAFRCGIGMVKYLGPECNRVILQTLLPEAMYDALPETLNDGLSEAHHDAVPESAVHDGRERVPAFTGSLAGKLSWGDYLIIGPGLSKEKDARELVTALFDPAVKAVLSGKKLIVLDADALNLMAEEGLNPGVLAVRDADDAGSPEGVCSADNAGSIDDACNTDKRRTPVVITPHVVEMSRLTGIPVKKIKEDPAAVAGGYARTHGIYVVLKDARTVVACPNVPCEMPAQPAAASYLIDSGCGAMAKAGSGDVLCGFIAGFTAMLRGDVDDALALAVFMHGAAGCVAAERMGCHSILARDIAEAAGEALQRSLGLLEPVRNYDLRAARK